MIKDDYETILEIRDGFYDFKKGISFLEAD